MHIETDCIGSLPIDDEVLYGINTVRALTNFPISREPADPLLFKSLIMIKKAAATVNQAAGTLPAAKAKAIIAACNELLLGRHSEALVAPAIQGSAGTSVNMNVNEVVAKLAHRLSPATKVHPNDDVNRCQSTNDTYPSAGKMALLQGQQGLLQALDRLSAALHTKAKTYQSTIKVARTQLQDAVPMTYGQSFHAYASMFGRDLTRLRAAAAALSRLNLGGTAVGTGLNATAFYRAHIIEATAKVSGLPLHGAPDLIDATQNADVYVDYSNALKTLAVNLGKFANDLRLLGSGPQAGLNELKLPARQAGSSIMPSKVNPVIPEVVNQVAFEVMGHNVTVTMAAEAGQLELNAFEPIIFRDLLQDQRYMAAALTTLVDHCVSGLTVNEAQATHNVAHSAIAATILSPYLGYQATANLIQQAVSTSQPVQALLHAGHQLPDALIDQLFSPAVLPQFSSQVQR
ncbi:aspartate ammonia-lyase [Lacticaseibacillus camelliae]|uniref:Aspartate ammonia-lyase n=1 Tax=Lacticaseibacillus camelliae DSM 22697 = JCM 13995 TaxID=1423730 RepID=A0A0R2FCL4_9LACO|nr:aspartate ammonia-lyase [Lacticaseibacillus camelliae]KRN22493.1 aspartate ammonia-lyase [Lacticaseibacillus camelliae DSM 22697 = JCM 13995]